MDTNANNTEQPIKIGFWKRRKIKKLVNYCKKTIVEIEKKVQSERDYRKQVEEQILQLNDILEIETDEGIQVDKTNISMLTNQECIDIIMECILELEKLTEKR